MVRDAVGSVVSLAVIADAVANSAQLLFIASEVLLTPLVLIVFTILPNVDGAGTETQLYEVFVALTVLLGVIYLLSAVNRTYRRYRRENGN